jgi:addiction module HigA family antidote
MRVSQMHRPPHPGEILRELCLKPLNLTVTDAAKALGVSRKTLSAILNGRAGISPEMAVRLSIAFDTTAESWLRQQSSMTSGSRSSLGSGCTSASLPPPSTPANGPAAQPRPRPATGIQALVYSPRGRRLQRRVSALPGLSPQDPSLPGHIRNNLRGNPPHGEINRSEKPPDRGCPLTSRGSSALLRRIGPTASQGNKTGLDRTF